MTHVEGRNVRNDDKWNGTQSDSEGSNEWVDFQNLGLRLCEEKRSRDEGNDGDTSENYMAAINAVPHAEE